MITKEDKINLIELLKEIDVKKLTIEHNDSTIEKWYRFGNYNALQLVSEIIKELPENDKIS
jgi:hypothetical protein